jgi:hypothetical protein
MKGERQRRLDRIAQQDTAHTMTEESTRPDLETLVRRLVTAVAAGDLDAAMRFMPPARSSRRRSARGSALRGVRRPRGSTGWVQLRYGSVLTWVDGLIEQTTNYLDPDQARAAAERLGQERG